MSVADRLAKFLETEGLTQAALASQLGVDQSSISSYITGRRAPDRWTLLMLAAISRKKVDRDYFLQASGVAPEQLAMIGALSEGRAATTEEINRAKIASIVAWLQSPVRNPTDRGVREMVYELSRIPH